MPAVPQDSLLWAHPLVREWFFERFGSDWKRIEKSEALDKRGKRLEDVSAREALDLLRDAQR